MGENEKEILSITGMSCAACAKAVERSVSKVEGVSSATVNFANEKLNVEFDEGKTDLNIIKEAIKRQDMVSGMKRNNP